MQKFLVWILAISFFASSAMAGQKSLAVVTRTDGPLTADLILITDVNDDITGMKVNVSDGSVINIKPSELLGKGKVLNRKMNVDVLIVKARNLDVQSGGVIVLDYLKKFQLISDNLRDSFSLDLTREKNGWQLSYKSRPVRELKAHVTSNGISSFTIK